MRHAIMRVMDTTHGMLPNSADSADGLLDQLAAVDPADAPTVAEQLAGLLSAELDIPSGEGQR